MNLGVTEIKEFFIKKLALSSTLGLDEYLLELPVVKALARGATIDFQQSVTFLVGENGTGKSTLMEALAIALGFNEEGGSKNFRFSAAATVSNLSDQLVVSKFILPDDGFFLRAESFYNLATKVDELGVSGYGNRSLHNQSHGESFLTLVEERFRGNGLYLLDEPEAALSPMRILSLMVQLDRLVKAKSQVIIATHSPILMTYPGATIYSLDYDGIKKVNYQETEHFKLTKEFLNEPSRMLHYLLDDPE